MALVVEIVSPGSTVNDRVTELAVYAAAGIDHYWIVDLPAGGATCYVLDAGTYRFVAQGPVVDATAPVAIRIDVAALVDPA